MYFSIMGLYLPYFNLYLAHIHLTGVQIGTLSAIRSILLVVFPIAWGMLADRLQARRGVYLLCALASAAASALYLVTTGFHGLVWVTILYGIFYSPIISFLESFTMDILGHRKTSYGQTRVWGSIAFIAVVLITGKLIHVFPIHLILVMVLSFGILQAALALFLPEIRRPASPGGPVPPAPGRLGGTEGIVFLTAAFLMLMSHGGYYGFFSIHLEQLGFDSTFIGIAWAVASISEIAVMLRSRSFFKRFSLENVMIGAFGVAAARWFLLSGITTGPLIWLTQVLHAVTYGAFHMACILYIDRLSSEKSKTLGQAVNNAVSYGLGLMAGFFVSGYLFETAGSRVMFVVSGYTAVAGGLLLVFYRALKPPVSSKI